MIRATREEIKSGNLPEIEIPKLTKEQARMVAILIYETINNNSIGDENGKD